MTTHGYRDHNVVVDADTLTIRGYYFPWFGAKHVPLSTIRIVTRIPLSNWGGRWRLWGSTTFRYWANLDMKRPSKDTAFILDTGAAIKPFITPDDPNAFEKAVRAALPGTPFMR